MGREELTNRQERRAILRRFWKIVGWVEALRNPTEPTKCWVTLLLRRRYANGKPLRVYVPQPNLRSLRFLGLTYAVLERRGRRDITASSCSK
jgi:hypothetical protein